MGFGLLLAVRILLGLGLAAWIVYTCISLWAARQWRRSRRPLDPDWTPGVTILKPVRGVDAEAYANFASFCLLDYPADRVQIVYGALDPDDPALALARQVAVDYPECDIKIVAAGPDAVKGLNFKVCNLLAMLPAARHDLLALCDSDMRVQPDYLRRIVAPFQKVIPLQTRPDDEGITCEPESAGPQRYHKRIQSSPRRRTYSLGAQRSERCLHLPSAERRAPLVLRFFQPGLQSLGRMTATFRAARNHTPSEGEERGRNSGSEPRRRAGNEEGAEQAQPKSEVDRMPRHPTPDTRHPVVLTPDPRPPGAEPEVGLVTCPYRGTHPQSLPALMEALSIGADFIPSALVSRALEGVSFAFGSTILLPRRVLEELGGFESLLDELADDFRLGDGARRAGYTVTLSDYVVDDVLGPEQFGATWARRLRWARTVRACRPAGYAGAYVTYGTAQGLLFCLAMGFNLWGRIVLLSVLAFRCFSATLIGATCTGDTTVTRWWPLLPLSDLLSFCLYVASYCGNRITWRGEQFRLMRGGRLEKRV